MAGTVHRRSRSCRVRLPVAKIGLKDKVWFNTPSPCQLFLLDFMCMNVPHRAPSTLSSLRGPAALRCCLGASEKACDHVKQFSLWSRICGLCSVVISLWNLWHQRSDLAGLFIVSLGAWLLFIWQRGKVSRQQELAGTAEAASVTPTRKTPSSNHDSGQVKSTKHQQPQRPSGH